MPSAVPLQVALPGPAVQISAQYQVVCALLDDRSLWCWGDNTEGQAGQGDSAPGSDALSPLQVPGTDWERVAAGQGHVCAIRASGALWCWGRNLYGELGQGNTVPDQIRTPVQVGSDLDWSQVAMGIQHTCALRDDASLWCWGIATGQQLGLDDTTTRSTPTRVGTGNDWVSVDASALHGCGLRAPGTLWCWGRNDEGQLGLSYDPVPVPVPTQIGSRQDWVELSVGWFHTCLRASDDTLHCSGANDEGRVGDDTFTRPYAFVPVSAFP
jgi:alpha-tubulin suppressor-like RCC1 family protein